jgi:hypothetical protein
MLKNYTPFVGKICTVMTGPTSFPFRDVTKHADYFSGLVTDVNEEGIFIKNLNFNTLAFYAFPIVGIVEEQVVAKSDPNFEKVKNEIEKTKPPVRKPAVAPSNNFLSIEEMTKMAKNIKSGEGSIHRSS